MINIEHIKSFFAPQIRNNPSFKEYMIKEYILLLILEYLSYSDYIKKIVFIGGTNLRLLKGIDRFSEDIDFDCTNLEKSEFIKMTNDIVSFLKNNGFEVETPDKKNKNIKAFRRNLYFPELLFNLGLTGHREKRFLIKIESQDQLIEYQTEIKNIKGCGMFFPIPVPTDQVLCSMKISAMLNRQKGRDFYDVIFLLSQTNPDFSFLKQKCNISNMKELKIAAKKTFDKINLNNKMKDFQHLIINKASAKKILHVEEFFNSLAE